MAETATTKRTVLNNQAREFVVRLQDYFERESQNGGPILLLSQVTNRIAAALGISRKNCFPNKDAKMTGRKSLFMFLMGLAWKCRFSMPLLLSGTVAVLGHAWMFQIRIHTVHRLPENELGYYDEEEDEDDGTWETESTDSWETIVEEAAFG